MKAGDNRKAAEWISNNTPQSEPIYVWGMEATIYDLSNRAPASRFIYNLPLRTPWSRDRARRELMTSIIESRPSAIVTVEGCVVDLTTTTSAEELTHFDELRYYIQNRYRPSFTSGEITVFLRKDLWRQRKHD